MSEKTKRKIKRLLPDGNVFGSAEGDEFNIRIGGKNEGVFKRFETLSVPFTFTGRADLHSKLFEEAQRNGSSFAQELETNKKATGLAQEILSVMEMNPVVSKQLLDRSLAEAYIKDNILSGLFTKPAPFEMEIARIVTAWKHNADFYTLEGLLGGIEGNVGGAGSSNPFENKNGDHSLSAGIIDASEDKLPGICASLSDFDRNKLLLQLSSIIGRDYKHMGHGIKVLEVVKGESSLVVSGEEVETITKGIEELGRLSFDKNIELGKLYNTIIRFHNWLPLALKQDGPEGDTYDGICLPSKRAIAKVSDEEIAEQLATITDATSPRGLGSALAVDFGLCGDKARAIRDHLELEENVVDDIESGKRNFYTLDLDDHAFYAFHVGGKWRGLKLLSDARKVFGLSYQVPQGFVITSTAIGALLEQCKVLDELYKDIFTLDAKRRGKIERLILKSDIFSVIPELKERIEELGTDNLIFRSSMYGEDGSSNQAGTYKSAFCDNCNWNQAITEVIGSYFTEEAISSRTDVGLSHSPGIAVIVQKAVKGMGGVIQILEVGARVTYATNAQDAVEGKGNEIRAETLAELLALPQNAALKPYGRDFQTLYETFGNIDVEFVIGANELYLIQMRPKPPLKMPSKADLECLETVKIETIDALKTTRLTEECIVIMEFLGRENLMDQDSRIMDFVRANRHNVKMVKGYMSSLAHIPNKIEGHFGLPYVRIEKEEHY